MNILLIDDDVNLRRSLRLALETMQHEVTIDPAIAASARRAVERMLAVK